MEQGGDTLGEHNTATADLLSDHHQCGAEHKLSFSTLSFSPSPLPQKAIAASTKSFSWLPFTSSWEPTTQTHSLYVVYKLSICQVPGFLSANTSSPSSVFRCNRSTWLFVISVYFCCIIKANGQCFFSGTNYNHVTHAHHPQKIQCQASSLHWQHFLGKGITFTKKRCTDDSNFSHCTD